jgi:cyclic pyranopterin phosphate synthase
MTGERLSLEVVRGVLEDAAAAGVSMARLYGGEPMLHPDLAEMIRIGNALGLTMYVTSNGALLEHCLDALVEAGLRSLTLGFYGTGTGFDTYTQRPGQRGAQERGLALLRERYGTSVEVQLNYVVVRPLASLEILEEAWRLVEQYDLRLHLDLYGYSIPFFTSGPEGELAFGPEDRPGLEALVDRLLQLRAAHPGRFQHSEAFLRSVPDWVLQCADMRVPCDAYELVWIGADGSVQLCDTSFPLGNVRETRLRDLLFTPEHHQAARDAFELKCPNCTCKVDSRLRRHGPSWRKYSQPGGMA